jgi:hypothetical protein
VYLGLQEAKIALEEWKSYTIPYQNWSKINQLALKMEKEIYIFAPREQGNERHLFAWGNTPQGKTQFIDTLLNDTDRLYMLVGQPGLGKSTFLARMAEQAVSYGLDIEYYHNTLDPEKLDLIILPALRIAFVINAEPYTYTPKFEGEILTLDFEQSLNVAQLMGDCGEEIRDCQQRVNQHISRAQRHSDKAKATHDILEKYYVPAMNFADIEKKRNSILEKILTFAE